MGGDSAGVVTITESEIGYKYYLSHTSFAAKASNYIFLSSPPTSDISSTKVLLKFEESFW